MMEVRARYLLMLLYASSLLGQDVRNPLYKLEILGVCGSGPVEGLPGAAFDDGTRGEPFFDNSRAGHNFEIWLVKRESPADDKLSGSTHAWEFSVTAPEPLVITDISTKGTISCRQGEAPGCLGRAVFFNTTELTGLPFGSGPQTKENHGGLSVVLLGVDGGDFLTGDGEWLIARLRIGGRFPDREGDISTRAIFFTARIGTENRPVPPRVIYKFRPAVTEDNGNPPLELGECEITLRASRPAEFIRCDVDNNMDINVSDAVFILQELFLGGPRSACPAAADCNADGTTNITDPIYTLLFLLGGGSPPQSPFPDCGTVDGLQPQECPKGSTGCR